jgi:hypothetical protein
MIRIAAAFLLIAGLGCSPSAVYLEADSLTFNAIAPEYSSYVESDESMGDARKRARLALVNSWRDRIEASK